MPITLRHAPSLRLATVLAAALLASACGKARSGPESSSTECGDCHGAPPTSGAHLIHVQLASTVGVAYGDEWTTEEKDPTGALNAYSFGCGLCHPKDAARHQNGTTDVELSPAAGAPGGLRARNGAGAAYDKATGTCSNVYCHSSGQATPVYVTTPAWTSTTRLGCNGCHGDPPSYANGGPASASANSHIFLNWLGTESGHFTGLPGTIHDSRHGRASFSPDEQRASPMTCQTCHYDTVDPTNVAAGGFFYLDTGITTQLPGGAAGRFALANWKDTQCLTCHDGRAGSPAQGAGKVRPLRHVNGKRDVVFDPRTAPPATWLFGSAPRGATPTRPYFMTSARFPAVVTLPSDAGFDAGTGTPAPLPTLSYVLTSATYTPTTMTCSSVACHLGRSFVWGQKDFETATPTCNGCHGP